MRRIPPWSQKIEARNYTADFYTRHFWGGVSRYAFTPLIVTLSSDHSDITRFHLWSPIATGNHLNRAEKIQDIAQTTGTVDVFAHRGELPHVQIFMNNGPNPLTLDTQLLSYWFNRNMAVFQDYLVNMINDLRGGHCFGLSRAMRNAGGKITAFKLGHPVFDGGIRLCMFP